MPRVLEVWKEYQDKKVRALVGYTVTKESSREDIRVRSEVCFEDMSYCYRHVIDTNGVTVEGIRGIQQFVALSHRISMGELAVLTKQIDEAKENTADVLKLARQIGESAYRYLCEAFVQRVGQ